MSRLVRFGTVGAVRTITTDSTGGSTDFSFRMSHSVKMDPKPVISGFWPQMTHRSFVSIRVVFTIRKYDIVSDMISSPILTPPFVTNIKTGVRSGLIRFCDNIGSTRGALRRSLEVLLSDLDALE